MKKQLLTLLICLLAVSAWAADVTIKEAFGTAPTGGAKTSRFPFDGRYTTWYYNFARSKTTDVIGSDRAFWTDHKTNSADNKDCYLETTIEGGLKAVSFKWQQGNKADYPDNLYLGIEINDVQVDSKEAASVNTAGAITANTYSHTFAVKGNNVKFALFNRSTTTRESPTDIGRILIGPITITPYLLYTQKDVTIGLKQQGYYNDELIDNTGNEGTISYSSSAMGVATVDEYGVITPVSVGDAIITAEWSEGVSTTYTLHVVDGVIAENFSKVKQTSQIASTEWPGDLFDWEVANVRRGADDTLGLSPRIQATAFRNNAGSSLVTKEVVEGGVKHVAFDWRQWASATSPLTIDMYYSSDKENWGDAVATQSEEAVKASTEHVFDADIDDGAKGNAYLKLNYTSGAGVAVLGAMKITPWLLYTTKEATLDTRVNLTYTNTGLINNTTGDAPIYEIAPANAAVSINGEGQVAVEDGADVNSDFTVTATWGAVTTTYTLHILSRSTANVSFAEAAVRIGLDGSVDNALNKDSHDGTAVYSSDNDAVATVNPATGAVTLQGGVGQVKISVSLPQTDNYKAASASYNLYVRDNGARKEAFGGVHIGDGVVGETAKPWDGDLFPWTAQYSIRKNANDTIWGATKGVWIGTGSDAGGPGVLNTTDEIEGGIKYLSFYWKQWANESGKTLRIAAFDGETRKGYMEYVPSGATTHEKFLLGINDMMRGNRKLYIKNESYTGASFDPENITTSNSRIILDTIYITPYLLYTTKARTLDMKSASSCTYTPEIDNTESGSITYSLEDNDGEASIDEESGEVTGIKAGEVTVKATWSEGAFTTYTLTILAKSVAEASYPNAIVRIGLDEAVDNTLAYTTGYDGTIAYASSNTAVADFEAGALVIKGVGQTTITATLPETDNYFATEASYNLYVRDNTNARIENFSNVETGHGVIGVKDTVWTGTYFDWIPTGAIRHNNSDTIWGNTNPDNVKVWIATAASTNATPINAGVMASKDVVEGGIKYLSFYWKQWASETNRTLRIAAFDGETRKGFMEYVPSGASTHEKFLFGVNDMMRNNHVLSIKNESFKTETFDGTIADDGNASRSRLIIDDIYITPYLLYTDKAKRVMRIGETYKNASLINNTGADASYESSNTAVATVAADGTVTAVGRGTATITASYKWNENEEVSTWYDVEVFPVNCETFDGIAETSNYANVTPRVGDMATWTTSLGGFNVGDCGALTTNLVRFRAPYQESSDEAYIQSTAIEGGVASMTFDWNLGGAETATNWDIRVIINGREVKKLTNTDITATNAMDHFEQITINDIDEPGNFTIRFENHSTISGAYTSGNKARFLIDNITWTSYEGTKTLAEDTNNEGWIRANGGQTRDVIISRSALVGGVWNTLCLPFAISKADDLDGAEVKEMTGVAMNGDVLEIYFGDIEGGDLQAGKPYLVKPASNKDISGTYSSKQIVSFASPVVQENVTMQGLFSPLAVTANDYNTLFVGTPDGEGNNLFYPQANGTLRGLRAYFKIGGAQLSAPLRRARYVINQKDIVTGMEDVQGNKVQCTKIIRDGQLFIIRDGKMYNVQGQVIK